MPKKASYKVTKWGKPNTRKVREPIWLLHVTSVRNNMTWVLLDCTISLFIQRIGYIVTGSWKGRENQ